LNFRGALLLMLLLLCVQVGAGVMVGLPRITLRFLNFRGALLLMLLPNSLSRDASKLCKNLLLLCVSRWALVSWWACLGKACVTWRGTSASSRT
jgi:hypothetical protein